MTGTKPVRKLVSRINIRKCIPVYITFNLQKIKSKEKILKDARRVEVPSCRRTKIRINREMSEITQRRKEQ